MAGLVVRESVTVAGRAERARVARAFVGGVLGPGHPCGDNAALLVSDSLNNHRELQGSDVAAGQVNRANSQGQVGPVLTSSSKEEAGESFRARCPLSMGLRSTSLPMRYVDRDIPSESYLTAKINHPSDLKKRL